MNFISTRRVLAAATILTSLLLLACQKEEAAAARVPIRIGWQIPLATQGQVVQVLKKTDLLQRHGLEPTFVPFSYGGPQSEAALAGELDVIFVGDQPAINLIARGGKWKIVSRLFYTRTGIMVPVGSTVSTMLDLRGKTVASPFGSVAHREAVFKEQDAGLDPDHDVTNLNLDILEISNLVQAGGAQSWRDVDAVGVWEPTTALLETAGLGRVLDYTRTLGVVAVSEEFIAKHRHATVQFLTSTLRAWAYFATHTASVNGWYVEDAKLAYTPRVLELAASVEPNYTARSLADVDLDLSDEHITTLERGAAWAHERGFAKTTADIRSAVDRSLLRDAKQIAAESANNIVSMR